MYIGSHISIRHGYAMAARTASSLGMTAYQFFAKNPRSLAIKRFDPVDAAACKRYVEEQGIRSIIHAPYPANLAAEEEQVRQATIRSLRNDLDICDACGANGLVVHFGKIKGDVLRGYQLIIRTLDDILSTWHGAAYILLENQAGDGGSVGTTLEELSQIRRLSSYSDKIGFCFDTCHAYASGLWNGHNTDELLSRGNELAYWEHLKAIHLNDSLYGSGLKRDRHAPLGRGKIGFDTMAQLLDAQMFRHIPWILETPEQKDYTHTEQIVSFTRHIR